jgi:hypothetical protein
MSSHLLKFKDVDADESHAIRDRGIVSFDPVGCSGDFKEHLPGSQVAKAMAVQIANPREGGGNPTAVGASFLFRLGDVVYKDDDPSDPEGKDQAAMYNSQFYAQFADYGREIFTIAGNHDGKTSAHAKKSAIFHFLQNFCDSKRKKESRQSNPPKQPADNDSALCLLVVRNGGLLCHLSLHE